MSYSTKENDWILGASLATAVTASTSLDVRDTASGSVQLTWTGATANDGSFKLQESLNGTSWADVTSGSQTTSGGAGTKVFHLDVVNVPFYRYVYSKGTETTGTYGVRYYFRGSK